MQTNIFCEKKENEIEIQFSPLFFLDSIFLLHKKQWENKGQRFLLLHFHEFKCNVNSD